ncbi:hypothetical protein [Maridesulfovibrio sp. FT414]|uniref:hypothetical protein n=1 Tax=Maridesulfovibrio sp. FT414 TaxID=2979469 RepID=UPI003D809939
MIVGIDLDNTIISYDKCLHKIALERGCIPDDFPLQKRTIRDHVRREFGDIEWQKLQIAIYGDSIGDAELMPGAWKFLSALKERGYPFKIVSHKTRYPNFGDVKVDLRQSAMDFLNERGFFDSHGLGMCVEDVFFLSTRKAKVMKIAELECGIFIDDLEEVFVEPGFPEGVLKILFSPESEDRVLPGVVVFSTFDQITDYTLNIGRNTNG